MAASPEITVADIEKFEQQNGLLKAGEIVIFTSGYSDTYCQSLPRGLACMVEPLDGKREGWPAPGPDAINYLAAKGIRCVATDGPTLGGAEAKRALWTYWALGTKGMVGVEFLTAIKKAARGGLFHLRPHQDPRLPRRPRPCAGLLLMRSRSQTTVHIRQPRVNLSHSGHSGNLSRLKIERPSFDSPSC